MSASGNTPNVPQTSAHADLNANVGASTSGSADTSPRAQAQNILHHISKKNATLDNVQHLLELVEKATKAPPYDIADFFASHMGANVPWDRGVDFKFANVLSLLEWRDVESHGVTITISHAFSAVSMNTMSYYDNAVINHSADVVDGVIKGVSPVFSGHRFPIEDIAISPAYALGKYIATAKWKKFTMDRGYGRANHLGDVFGDWLALDLTLFSTLTEAFRATRKRMSL